VSFGPDVVAAVCRHMNDDHPDDSLLICRTLGAAPDATAARMTGLDADGADFEVTGASGVGHVRLPWSTTVTERRQIRLEVVRMYREACAAAGREPRTAAPH
jgi:putative heme iron utilization protein